MIPATGRNESDARPPSRDGSAKASTCIVVVLVLDAAGAGATVLKGSHPRSSVTQEGDHIELVGESQADLLGI